MACDTCCNCDFILMYVWHFAIYLSFHMSLKDEMRLSGRYTCCFLFTNVWRSSRFYFRKLRVIAPLGRETSRVICHFRANKQYVKYFDIFFISILNFFSLTYEYHVMFWKMNNVTCSLLKCSLIC